MKGGKPHVSERRRLRNLQPVRALQIPCQLLQENSFRRGLSYNPQDREGSEPHRASPLLTHTLSLHPPSTLLQAYFFPGLFFLLDKKKQNYLLPLVFRAVAFSRASSLRAEKAAEATGDDTHSGAAHEYLKWIMEQREDRKGGIQWTEGGWENKSGLPICLLITSDYRTQRDDEGFGAG